MFRKKGRLVFLCTVKGHAAVGMKGTFGVGVTPPRVTTTTDDDHDHYDDDHDDDDHGDVVHDSDVDGQRQHASSTASILDKQSVPAGCIQFVIKNDGQVQHNFALIGIKAGANIGPGATETWAVQLTAGSKNYTCDVPFHDSFGMNGPMTVT